MEDHTLTLANIAWRLGAVFLLVLANAFMVAAEFALVAARRSRIDQMAAEGDRPARTVQKALDNLDRYISATQLGITIASLGLGWIGEPAVAVLVDRVFDAVGIPGAGVATHRVISVIIAFGFITFLHIVLGELAPKSVALIMPEKMSRIVARPLIIFSQVMAPFIYVLNGAANALLRMFGIHAATEASRVHSPEELRLLVMQAQKHGSLDESGSEMLAGVFDLRAKKARDVMRPRTEMVAIQADTTIEDARALVRTERYSRYPVYGESLDDILGVLLAKDLWLRENDAPFTLREALREVPFVPDSRPAERVLSYLRRERAHLGVVLDEYGGTAGIITVEDLVEEVIGDISDEDDPAPAEAVDPGGILELDGTISIMDVRSDHGLSIPEGDWTTLGGYAFSRLGRVPRVGDRVLFPGGELEVVAMDGRRVAVLRVLVPATVRVERK